MFTDEHHFGDFHDQPILPGYYNFLNDNDDDDNNTPGTPVEYFFPENKVVEDAVMPNSTDDYDNDEDNEDYTKDDDADNDTSDSDFPQYEVMNIEGVDAEN